MDECAVLLDRTGLHICARRELLGRGHVAARYDEGPALAALETVQTDAIQLQQPASRRMLVLGLVCLGWFQRAAAPEEETAGGTRNLARRAQRTWRICRQASNPSGTIVMRASIVSGTPPLLGPCLQPPLTLRPSRIGSKRVPVVSGLGSSARNP